MTKETIILSDKKFCKNCGKQMCTRTAHDRRKEMCSLSCNSLWRNKHYIYNKDSWPRGTAHRNWKTGKTMHSSGYVYLQTRGHPRAKSHTGDYVMEHIVVYEQYHKCCMLKWGVVHHINEVRNDNRIENLQGMTLSKHVSYHNKNKKEVIVS